MPVQNALAGVAAKDLLSTAKWYERLIGQPGNQPMPEVFEWSLPRGGALQVFEDAAKAGSSSVTFSVDKIEGYVDELQQRGIEVGHIETNDAVTTAIVKDPDGNRVVLAEQHTDRLAR